MWRSIISHMSVKHVTSICVPSMSHLRNAIGLPFLVTIRFTSSNSTSTFAHASYATSSSSSAEQIEAA